MWHLTLYDTRLYYVRHCQAGERAECAARAFSAPVNGAGWEEAGGCVMLLLT